MKLFKRKYQYLQHFLKTPILNDRSFLGFYRIGSDAGHQAFFDTFTDGAIFPHYGFSFYENPPGRIIMKGRGNTPSVFRSNRLNSLGLGSLIKRVTSQDMFTDHGLSFYRDRSFVMALGTAENLIRDLGFLKAPGNQGQEQFDLWNALDSQSWIAPISTEAYESLADQRRLYDEVFHLDIEGYTGYFDMIYLTADTMTSLVLSHTTVLNIIKTQARHLKPLFQMSLSADDEPFLTYIFNMDRAKVKSVAFKNSNHLLFGVFPGLFGFKGAVFDVATGMISGKRKDLVSFLLLLDGLDLLAGRDLRYLV